MGGPIAQLMWRAPSPSSSSGMVFAATGAEFVAGETATVTRRRRSSSRRPGPASAARRPGCLDASFATMTASNGPRERPDALAAWGRPRWPSTAAGRCSRPAHAIANYSAKDWIGEIDVPTSVIVTESDSAVDPAAQLRMAMAIPEAHINRIPGGHVSCIDPDFGRKVTDACLDVARRLEAARKAS